MKAKGGLWWTLVNSEEKSMMFNAVISADRLGICEGREFIRRSAPAQMLN